MPKSTLSLLTEVQLTFPITLIRGDKISVYPVFESLDISEITRIRPKPLRELKFVLDVHLGKLCKYLRILGFDSAYRNNFDDSEIVNIFVDEKRIILTCDIGILKNGAVIIRGLVPVTRYSVPKHSNRIKFILKNAYF